ncbi:helicase associated domain-containing protein [Streptomyces coeruleorubidus]
MAGPSRGHPARRRRSSWWKVAARDLITYPETVALARLLADHSVQERTVTESRRHLPYRLGELPGLLAELADQLGRPWLAHHLATVTHGPLFTWAHSCVHARAASTPAAHRTLWKVHSSHWPRPLSDLLPHAPAADGTPPATKPARRLRGHSLQAEQAFQTGLAQAHAYHQQHGHLAVPKEDTPADYPLGQWLANTRARHTRMPAHQAAALTALYPWWNAPWSTLWQRTWHQALTHHQTHGPLKPARGFPTTSYSLGEWLYLQCTRYPALHPEQQRLLTQIDIDAAAAAAARPRRRNLKASAEEALAHARSYAAEHGSLASVTSSTVHDGFRLGQWLANQRNYQRTGHRPLPAGRAQALTAIDPWWCPPWHLTWQRHYHRAQDAAAGRRLQAENGFNTLDDSGAADWLWRQCATYDELSEEQRQLLAGIGITPPSGPHGPGPRTYGPKEARRDPGRGRGRQGRQRQKSCRPCGSSGSAPPSACHRAEAPPRAPQPPRSPPRSEAGLRNSPDTRPGLARRTRPPRSSA